MNSVFYIGSSGLRKELEDVLRETGAHIRRFSSINAVNRRPHDNPDVIIADRKQSRERLFREFLRTFRETPILVLADSDTFTGFSPWLRHRLVYPLSLPSPKAFAFALQKILHEKKLSAENQLLKIHLSDIRKELDFFVEMSRTLTSSLELHEVLGAIIKKAKNLIKAETWTILLIDEETGDLVFDKSTGKKEGRRKPRKERLKLGEGIAGWVAQEQIPVIVPDVSKDPRFRARLDAKTDLKTHSLMCVPIRNKGNILGVLEIVNKTNDEPFTKDNLDLLLRIVDHAAIAIERAALYQKMAEMSITDDLTKLFNTRYLNRTLEMEITRANRHRTSIALIFMDIDHFKNVNDNYGHLVGSKLLVEMGQLLLKSLRTVDIVARYGGDEFVIVLPQTTPRNAVQIAERIRRSIEQNVFLKKDGYAFKITASFGVASYPESATSKEDLLRLADEAMYRVKYQTRNGVYAIV
jgi:diguanylate cyclase (GGDEF)-like protein